jgi:ammonia channel protein AmtB
MYNAAALTAGLPLNLPSHQLYLDPALLDRGDTAWMLLSTIFGIFLSPALAYLYSKLYSYYPNISLISQYCGNAGTVLPIGHIRNVSNSRIVQLTLLTTSVITLTWVLFTYGHFCITYLTNGQQPYCFDVSTCRYSLCYGKDIGRFVGNPDTFYMFRNTYGQPGDQLGAETVPSAIVAIYELGFALAAPTMIACSLAGTVNVCHVAARVCMVNIRHFFICQGG